MVARRKATKRPSRTAGPPRRARYSRAWSTRFRRRRSAPLASVVLSAGVGALYLAQSAYWSVTADIAGSRAGFASGFMNMGGQLGGALTATLTPIIAENYGWISSFITAAVLVALGGLAWFFVEQDKRLVLADQASP